MKKYHAMELSELLEESAARGLEYHFSKDRPTMITSLRAFDQARQRENTAAAQHFDSFNDSNDPMYRNRIEVRFGMLSAYISHQQRERQNRIKYLRDFEDSDLYVDNTSKIKQAKDNEVFNVDKAKSDFNDLEASSTSLALAIAQRKEVPAGATHRMQERTYSNKAIQKRHENEEPVAERFDDAESRKNHEAAARAPWMDINEMRDSKIAEKLQAMKQHEAEQDHQVLDSEKHGAQERNKSTKFGQKAARLGSQKQTGGQAMTQSMTSDDVAEFNGQNDSDSDIELISITTPQKYKARPLASVASSSSTPVATHKLPNSVASAASRSSSTSLAPHRSSMSTASSSTSSFIPLASYKSLQSATATANISAGNSLPIFRTTDFNDFTDSEPEDEGSTLTSSHPKDKKPYLAEQYPDRDALLASQRTFVHVGAESYPARGDRIDYVMTRFETLGHNILVDQIKLDQTGYSIVFPSTSQGYKHALLLVHLAEAGNSMLNGKLIKCVLESPLSVKHSAAVQYTSVTLGKSGRDNGQLHNSVMGHEKIEYEKQSKAQEPGEKVPPGSKRKSSDDDDATPDAKKRNLNLASILDLSMPPLPPYSKILRPHESLYVVNGRPIIYIGTKTLKRPVTHADLELMWQNFWATVPGALEYIVGIQASTKGIRIYVKRSGDIFLAARDCWLISFGAGWDVILFEGVELIYGDFDNASERVADRYKPVLSAA